MFLFDGKFHCCITLLIAATLLTLQPSKEYLTNTHFSDVQVWRTYSILSATVSETLSNWLILLGAMQESPV